MKYHKIITKKKGTEFITNKLLNILYDRNYSSYILL